MSVHVIDPIEAMGALHQRERNLVKACLDLLRFRGVFAWRQNCGGVSMPVGADRRERFVRFTSINGVSDIIGILPNGRFLAVECKRAGNKPTPDQIEFMNAVRRRGGVALVVYDVANLADILDRELQKAVA